MQAEPSKSPSVDARDERAVASPPVVDPVPPLAGLRQLRNHVLNPMVAADGQPLGDAHSSQGAPGNVRWSGLSPGRSNGAARQSGPPYVEGVTEYASRSTQTGAEVWNLIRTTDRNLSTDTVYESWYVKGPLGLYGQYDQYKAECRLNEKVGVPNAMPPR
jgi:hypothetical protein